MHRSRTWWRGAKRDGDNIVGIFRDEGETGTNMTRSAFEEMIV
jgi:site-specific DNA recombinase